MTGTTRILLTGATGQVGRRFLPRLVQWAGPDAVRVLVRDPARVAQAARAGVEVVTGDLREPGDRAKALAGATAVVNVAAAFRGVPDEEALAVNRDAAVALGREAAAAGVRRFVQASTNLVYPDGLGRPALESDPVGPSPRFGVYPRSKAQAETGLRELVANLPGDPAGAMELTVVRLAFVYGEGDSHLSDFLPRLAHWPAHKRLPVVHHADVAQALWRALSMPSAAGRTYNAVDDAPVTAYDIHALHGLPLPAGAAGATDQDPWSGMASNALLRAELGWRPLYPSLWTARDAGAL
ncbi:NAD-dependent epimerase/dehydratase family protein [Kitasatospora sp. NBC_01266]|uniref:NAD-dependent epimerase/dehydratase family protein n=1 Tax=Kitasatospora sp. NBC_01266 TaxID=2903572 RepID=UPI003FA5FB6A